MIQAVCNIVKIVIKRLSDHRVALQKSTTVKWMKIVKIMASTNKTQIWKCRKIMTTRAINPPLKWLARKASPKSWSSSSMTRSKEARPTTNDRTAARKSRVLRLMSSVWEIWLWAQFTTCWNWGKIRMKVNWRLRRGWEVRKVVECRLERLRIARKPSWTGRCARCNSLSIGKCTIWSRLSLIRPVSSSRSELSRLRSFWPASTTISCDSSLDIESAAIDS